MIPENGEAKKSRPYVWYLQITLRPMQNCDKEQMYLFYINRIINEMIDVFKIVSQGNGPKYLRKLFKASEHRYNRRSILSLELPKYRTVKYGRNCFKFHGAKLWNSLDTSFKCAIDLQSFIERIRSWNGHDLRAKHVIYVF